MKYTKEILEEAVANSSSVRGTLRALGINHPSGGMQNHISARIKKFEIDTSHFTGRGHNKGKRSSYRKTPDQILIILPPGSSRPKVVQLRRAMLESGVEYKCLCGLTDEWQDARLVLEVDHIDGDWLNNQLDNLRFLCPNCHSQTATSRSWKNTKGIK